jgi:hypothetical protein
MVGRGKADKGAAGQQADVEQAAAELLEPYSPEVRELAMQLRALVREVVPDAAEEAHPPTKMIGFTFIPGTYKGLILTVSPQKDYVNIIFGKGVELLELDSTGLLEGTGKVARHIKFRSPELVRDPQVRMLIEEAAKRTRR